MTGGTVPRCNAFLLVSGCSQQGVVGLATGPIRLTRFVWFWGLACERRLFGFWRFGRDNLCDLRRRLRRGGIHDLRRRFPSLPSKRGASR